MLMKVNAAAFLTPKDKRLRELAIYISEKCGGDDSFGATKLNKLLFYSDFLAYLNFGKPITGSEYFRLGNGPAPKRWIPVREAMVEAGDAKVMDAEFYGFPQQRVVPLRKAQLTEFSTDQISLVDKVIALHKGKTAKDISDESHGFVGWVLAQDRETIPYQVARVTKCDLTENELKHGVSLEKEATVALRGEC